MLVDFMATAYGDGAHDRGRQWTSGTGASCTGSAYLILTGMDMSGLNGLETVRASFSNRGVYAVGVI